MTTPSPENELAIFICAPRPVEVHRRVRVCFTEKKRRRMIVTYYGWYGAEWECCGCGDRWSDGERLMRPFERGWRTRATADARKRWQEIGR